MTGIKRDVSFVARTNIAAVSISTELTTRVSLGALVDVLAHVIVDQMKLFVARAFESDFFVLANLTAVRELGFAFVHIWNAKSELDINKMEERPKAGCRDTHCSFLRRRNPRSRRCCRTAAGCRCMRGSGTRTGPWNTASGCPYRSSSRRPGRDSLSARCTPTNLECNVCWSTRTGPPCILDRLQAKQTVTLDGPTWSNPFGSVTNFELPAKCDLLNNQRVHQLNLFGLIAAAKMAVA